MFYVFLLAFLSGFILNSAAGYFGKQIKFFRVRFEDGQYGVSKLGGMAIVFSFFLAMGLAIIRFGSVSPKIVFVLGALLATFFLGAVDDLLNLSPPKKLIAQVVISVFLVTAGIKTQIVFLSTSLNILLTVFWFLAIMNAFNFLDILDGLAAGIVVLCALTFMCICYVAGNAMMGMMAAALLGSNLCFLLFNRFPARLYMGDAGSLFNGMVLAIMAIMISYTRVGSETALFTPLLILALPLYDLIFLIIMRWRGHKPIAKKSRDHFALRLIDKGMSCPRVVLLMCFFNILFNLAGIVLLRSKDSFGFCIFLLAVSVWLFAAYKISHKVEAP